MDKSKLVILNLGNGDLNSGFQTVILQVLEFGTGLIVQSMGSLPPAIQIIEAYKNWQILYQYLYHVRAENIRLGTEDYLEIYEEDVTNVSENNLRILSQDLKHKINLWLNSDSFCHINYELRRDLSKHEEIRVIIETQDNITRRLPWHLWNFFKDYPKTEIALSTTDYKRAKQCRLAKIRNQVRILVVLGDQEGIDINKDKKLIEKLPKTELFFLLEPTAKELNDELCKRSYNILFFAGHISSKETSNIHINKNESLTIEQLKCSFLQAIAKGLELVILNSCDGLGVAMALADLHIPQVIVMREQVPDLIAQEFLKYFLQAFSGGSSLYASVREARERLQGFEKKFPCATWLPVICQNPAEVPPTWQEWCGIESRKSWLGTQSSTSTIFNLTGVKYRFTTLLFLAFISTQFFVFLVNGLSYVVNRPALEVGKGQTNQQSPSQALNIANTDLPEKIEPVIPIILSSNTSQRGKPVRVAVTVKSSSWVRVVVDGKTQFEGMLPEGTQRTWVAENKLIVRASNAGGILVAINDEKAKKLGALGKVREVTFAQ